MIKTFEVSELPGTVSIFFSNKLLTHNVPTVRAGRFAARKNWIITGADDMHVRVFNYNTQEKVSAFEAHSDYVRSIAVHPTLPLFLTAADDMLIKLWDWDKGFRNVQVCLFLSFLPSLFLLLYHSSDSETVDL